MVRMGFRYVPEELVGREVVTETDTLDAVAVDSNTITGLLIVRVDCPLVVVGETDLELPPSVVGVSADGHAWRDTYRQR